MKVKKVSVAGVIRMIMLGLLLLVIGTIGLSKKAHAQDAGDVFVQIVTTVVGTVAGNVAVAGMDGLSCGATAGINASLRGGDSRYNQYQRPADYNSCLAQVNAQRQQEYYRRRAMEEQMYYQRMAMEQQARAMAMQNAPRCQYYEQNGVQYRSCTETAYGQWRR